MYQSSSSHAPWRRSSIQRSCTYTKELDLGGVVQYWLVVLLQVGAIVLTLVAAISVQSSSCATRYGSIGGGGGVGRGGGAGGGNGRCGVFKPLNQQSCLDPCAFLNCC